MSSDPFFFALFCRLVLVVVAFSGFYLFPGQLREYLIAAQTHTHELNFPIMPDAVVSNSWYCSSPRKRLGESFISNFFQAFLCSWDGSHYLWIAHHGYAPELIKTVSFEEKGPLGLGMKLLPEKYNAAVDFSVWPPRRIYLQSLHVEVITFYQRNQGEKLPAESSGMIGIGDVLLAVNGKSVIHEKSKDTEKQYGTHLVQSQSDLIELMKTNPAPVNLTLRANPRLSKKEAAFHFLFPVAILRPILMFVGIVEDLFATPTMRPVVDLFGMSLPYPPHETILSDLVDGNNENRTPQWKCQWRCITGVVITITCGIFASITAWQLNLARAVVLSSHFDHAGDNDYMYQAKTLQASDVLFVVFPSSMFLSVPYSEVIYTLLISAWFLQLALAMPAKNVTKNRIKGRTIIGITSCQHNHALEMAAFIGIFLPLARGIGAFMVVPLFVYTITYMKCITWNTLNYSERFWIITRLFCNLMAPVVGWIINLLVLGFLTGDALSGFMAQKMGFFAQFSVQGLLQPFLMIRNLLFLDSHLEEQKSILEAVSWIHPTQSVLDRLIFIFAIFALAIILLKRALPAWILCYVFVSIIIPPLCGSFMSLTRLSVFKIAFRI